jgi:hypothetical protein
MYNNILLIKPHPDARIHAPPKFSDNSVATVGTYGVAKFNPQKTVALLSTYSQWLLDELEIDMCIAFCIDR